MRLRLLFPSTLQILIINWCTVTTLAVFCNFIYHNRRRSLWRSNSLKRREKKEKERKKREKKRSERKQTSFPRKITSQELMHCLLHAYEPSQPKKGGGGRKSLSLHSHYTTHLPQYKHTLHTHTRARILHIFSPTHTHAHNTHDTHTQTALLLFPVPLPNLGCGRGRRRHTGDAE